MPTRLTTSRSTRPRPGEARSSVLGNRKRRDRAHAGTSHDAGPSRASSNSAGRVRLRAYGAVAVNPRRVANAFGVTLGPQEPRLPSVCMNKSVFDAARV